MNQNNLALFYLTCIKDYKKYWLKTSLSLIGLVLSISLVTTVSIYTSTINNHLNKPSIIEQFYPKNYITHQRGYLTFNDIKKLRNNTPISHGYPFKQISRTLKINDNEQLCTILGLDLILVDRCI